MNTSAKYKYVNYTPKGKQCINLLVNTISSNDLIACKDENTIRDNCRTGCINYGRKWCCPPYSQQITDINNRVSYDSAIIFIGYIDLSDMEYINNSYQKVKAANIILKSKCEKLAHIVEDLTKGYSLLSGSCNLCKPCRKKIGQPCKNPEKMRYSLESTGINVDLLSQKFCSHKLYWYKKNESIPYTSVVTAVLANSIDLEKLNYSDILNKIFTYKYY